MASNTGVCLNPSTTLGGAASMSFIETISSSPVGYASWAMALPTLCMTAGHPRESMTVMPRLKAIGWPGMSIAKTVEEELIGQDSANRLIAMILERSPGPTHH
jgi:hypothetical protein